MPMTKKQLFDHDFEGHAQRVAKIEDDDAREASLKGFAQDLHKQVEDSFRERVNDLRDEIEADNLEKEEAERRKLRIQHELDNPEL